MPLYQRIDDDVNQITVTVEHDVVNTGGEESPEGGRGRDVDVRKQIYDLVV